MIFGVGAIIEHITAVMTLLPGDVILTGTPSGVSAVNLGDTMEIEIDGIGTLTNRVVKR
jgi:2-keto-4-pentenoate hydratase/2-oxohepta-3-ene-1,7-dioic acid hydratase in catechol pathway